MNQNKFTEYFSEKYPDQKVFNQTVEEISKDVFQYAEENNFSEQDFGLIQRMFEPERIISFKVVWENDKGESQFNTGHRVQFNSSRGPYKGGLRFDKTVNLDILKFLALEQTFKNALTGLPLGSGKGGSDFDPKGKSDNEIKRFCKAFITELYRYIGAETDVPAGDMGVGSKEIGYMYGQYKKIQNRHTGILTGKGPEFGGSCGRTEATGYGVVYLAEHILKDAGHEMSGNKAVVSGAGNVASHVAEKLIQKGAIVLTLSEREGYLYKDAGFTLEDIDALKDAKEERMSLEDFAKKNSMEFKPGKVWGEKADLYFPSATQNEINEDDAKNIVESEAILLCEGANMPSSNEAVEIFQNSDVIFVPGKAANAGGVAVSGLEMNQNAAHDSWTKSAVEERLQLIMKNIFDTMKKYGGEEKTDYLRGANVGGFVKVFNAMRSLGW